MTKRMTKEYRWSPASGLSRGLVLQPGNGPRAGLTTAPRSGWETGTMRRSSAGPAGLASGRGLEPGGMVRAVRGWSR